MKTVPLSLVLIVLALLGNFQTFIPGGAISETLTIDGSPYMIKGVVMVPDDSMLTTDHGVILEFQGNYKFLIL